MNQSEIFIFNLTEKELKKFHPTDGSGRRFFTFNEDIKSKIESSLPTRFIASVRLDGMNKSRHHECKIYGAMGEIGNIYEDTTKIDKEVLECLK